MKISNDNLTKEKVFDFIAKSSIYGNLGLFIGAGFSKAIMNTQWNSVALSWKELIYKCSEELKVDFASIDVEGASYPEIASRLCKKYAEQEDITYIDAMQKLKNLIANLTAWYPSREKREKYGVFLSTLSAKWVITTNYDLIIEGILTGKSFSLGPNDQLISPKELIPVYHLHGIRTNPSSIIISQEDYISLFRPNEYRQHKLPLIIKESTTLIIGYSLGDFNVLTAVDWTKNVYLNQKERYPHDIIQLLYSETPKEEPYRDSNDIMIFEFNNLENVLNDISVTIQTKIEEKMRIKEQLASINGSLSNPIDEIVNKFIENNDDFRSSTLSVLAHNDTDLISGFLELFSKSMDETWKRASADRAFYAYNENLKILLDILETFEITSMPPALIESVAYNLNRVSYYIGNDMGKSYAAYGTWQARKSLIPEKTKEELRNIAKSNGYYSLLNLFKMK